MEAAFLKGISGYGAASVPIFILMYIAYQLWRQNLRNDERYHEEKIKDVEAKVKLDGTIHKLIEVIRSKLK